MNTEWLHSLLFLMSQYVLESLYGHCSRHAKWLKTLKGIYLEEKFFSVS